MTADALPDKQDVARALLLKGSVFVHLDPRLDSVFVPEWLKRQAQLVLQVGLDMPASPDLRVDDTGVYGTLSFNRAPFSCAVPWEAVFAVVGDDGRGMVWPDSMPKEIAAEVEREAQRARLAMPGAQASGVKAEQAGEGEKRRRRPRRAPEEPQPAPAPARSPRVKVAKPQTLELIVGKGERAASAKGERGERRPWPSYLRLVK